MKKYQREIIKLTSKEILLSLFDITTPFLEADRAYRQSIKSYLRKREYDKANFFVKLRYWQRQGYINTFLEGKEKFIELTPKGKTHLENLAFEEINIKRPQKWDGKWRIVIFDIPEKNRASRDTLRAKLLTLGFRQIQKSVYVYPFECTKEIFELSDRLDVKKSVLIMIAEIIQGENRIVKFFLNRDILNNSDLKN